METTRRKTERKIKHGITGKVFANVYAASKACYTNKTGILRCCDGKQKTSGGAPWYYAD